MKQIPRDPTEETEIRDYTPQATNKYKFGNYFLFLLFIVINEINGVFGILVLVNNVNLEYL